MDEKETILNENVEGEITEETKVEESVVSDIYRLYEMSDAIEASMKNMKEVSEKQLLIIDVLKDVEKEELNELIKSLGDQVDYIQIQYNELEARKELLKEVIKKCEEDENIKDIIDKLLKGVGIFKN